MKKSVLKQIIREVINEDRNIGHYSTLGNQIMVDSNFVQFSNSSLPNSELKHLGMGEFYLETPDGDIQFERSKAKISDKFLGRTHRVYDNKGGKLVKVLIAKMLKMKRAEQV